MIKELKKFPKELQDAYKKIPSRPSENTPAAIMSYLSEDQDEFFRVMINPFAINTIVEYVDPALLDLELDEKKGQENIYSDFAALVVKKIMGLVDLDTNKSKPLEIYDNNPKVTKLKQRDFTKIGDLSELSDAEKAESYADFYGIKEDDNFKSLTEWEKRLFVDKVSSRQDTNVEKK